MKAWPELTGVPFGRLQELFTLALPIGIKRHHRRGSLTNIAVDKRALAGGGAGVEAGAGAVSKAGAAARLGLGSEANWGGQVEVSSTNHFAELAAAKAKTGWTMDGQRKTMSGWMVGGKTKSGKGKTSSQAKTKSKHGGGGKSGSGKAGARKIAPGTDGDPADEGDAGETFTIMVSPGPNVVVQVPTTYLPNYLPTYLTTCAYNQPSLFYPPSGSTTAPTLPPCSTFLCCTLPTCYRPTSQRGLRQEGDEILAIAHSPAHPLSVSSLSLSRATGGRRDPRHRGGRPRLQARARAGLHARASDQAHQALSR